MQGFINHFLIITLQTSKPGPFQPRFSKSQDFESSHPNASYHIGRCKTPVQSIPQIQVIQRTFSGLSHIKSICSKAMRIFVLVEALAYKIASLTHTKSDYVYKTKDICPSSTPNALLWTCTAALQKLWILLTSILVAVCIQYDWSAKFSKVYLTNVGGLGIVCISSPISHLTFIPLRSFQNRAESQLRVRNCQRHIIIKSYYTGALVPW